MICFLFYYFVGCVLFFGVFWCKFYYICVFEINSFVGGVIL